MRVLFVCTGNICRSPTADGVLRAAIAQRGLRGWHSDSAGTQGYHVGDAPDARSIATAARHGVDLTPLRARQVAREDFYAFDLILAMDTGHLTQLQRLRPADATATLRLFLDAEDVPDPYYGNQAGFDAVFAMCQRGVARLLEAA